MDAYYNGCCNCMKIGKTLLELLEDGFLGHNICHCFNCAS